MIDPGYASYQSLQEQFIANYAKLDAVKTQFEWYDMMDIVMLSELWNESPTHPSQQYGSKKRNMLIDWTDLSYHHIKQWQKYKIQCVRDINDQMSQ